MTFLNFFVCSFFFVRSAHTFYLDCKEKLSTFASDTSSNVEHPQRKNNYKQVLDILDRKFNFFRNGIGKDSPDEAVGNVVQRTLHVDTFLDFINSTERPAIITPLGHTTKQSTAHLTHSQIRTFIETSFNQIQPLARRSCCNLPARRTCSRSLSTVNHGLLYLCALQL